MQRRALIALAPVAALGQRPIRVVVPFAAGGIIDVVARILAEPMGRALGQGMVIDNQPGAGSVIGARVVARAAADGATLLLSGAAHAVIPALYPDAGVDPVADFAPIALLGQQPFVLAVHPSSPARDPEGFLAWLRARPGQGGGQARFATTGIGAASHLAGELLKQLAGVDFEVVPYRGTPQAVTDLVAGRVDFMLDSQTLLAPLAAAGQLRALAVTTAARSALLPALPTLAETGIAGYGRLFLAGAVRPRRHAGHGTRPPGRRRRHRPGRPRIAAPLCRGGRATGHRRSGRLHRRRAGALAADPARHRCPRRLKPRRP